MAYDGTSGTFSSTKTVTNSATKQCASSYNMIMNMRQGIVVKCLMSSGTLACTEFNNYASKYYSTRGFGFSVDLDVLWSNPSSPFSPLISDTSLGNPGTKSAGPPPGVSRFVVATSSYALYGGDYINLYVYKYTAAGRKFATNTNNDFVISTTRKSWHGIADSKNLINVIVAESEPLSGKYHVAYYSIDAHSLLNSPLSVCSTLFTGLVNLGSFDYFLSSCTTDNTGYII